MLGVKVIVGVWDGVLVRTRGVKVRVVVPVSVTVGVTVGVRLTGSGARAIAMNPMQ
jgi:hypothetical protein